MPQKRKTKKKPPARHLPAPPPAERARSRPSGAPAAHPSSSLVIRPARPSDRPAIERLAGQLFPRSAPTFGDSDHYFVAHFGERLAGWVHLRERERSVVLQGLAVHPSLRRRGIGQALLRLALRAAQARRPARPVALKVQATNAPALSLYLQEGFSLRPGAGPAYLLRRLPPN
ncbi:MAG: GNAT family N-acetyltransferase [Candidatus Micrarchaeota archaeon]|nr:GNAT family N-acetyltransferase [Candidatus Micrarchaeota archaeon]